MKDKMVLATTKPSEQREFAYCYAALGKDVSLISIIRAPTGLIEQPTSCNAYLLFAAPHSPSPKSFTGRNRNTVYGNTYLPLFYARYGGIMADGW